MRRLTFTLLLMVSATFAANAQLTNGDLETWTAFTGTASYNEPGSGPTRTTHFLRTLNELNDITGPISVFRADSAHGGTYAARIRSVTFATYFIPGFLGTGDINFGAATMYLGRQYTSQPNSFSTWYKYAPAGGSGDSAKFEVIFTKYDALNQVSVPIGWGSSAVTTPTSTWTQLQFNITWDTVAAPDTAIIIAAASGGYNINNFLSSVGDIGSTLWVDDMTLQSGFVSTDPEYINENVNIYPNPATDFVNISLGNLPENLKLFVYDINGKQVMYKVMNGGNYLLDVSSLAHGVYGIVIQDNFNLIHRSRIVKQ